MIFWLNAQLPPSLAKWLTEKFGVRTVTRQYIAILNHLHNSCRGNPTPTPRGCPILGGRALLAPPLHICMNDLGSLYEIARCSIF